jgi:predicted regulator of Ras-like GTPase activity (Roadblock/LC7/MglB family)
MLSIFKKLFGRTESVAPAPAAVPVPQPPTAPVSSVEVVHLSLAAITARFPEELKSTLLREPDAAATVALPLPTILKQLPLGGVKMSLASLHRQAPGVFRPLAHGDKRMIEIPLAEVFRHVRSHLLKRRPDQRPLELPENAISLFGDVTNPRVLAPSAVSEEAPEPELIVPDPAPEPAPERPRMLKMDAGLREHFSSTPPRSMLVATAPPAAPELKLEAAPAPLRVIALPADFSLGKTAVASPAIPITAPAEGPSLALTLAALAANWPEVFRVEAGALDPATTVVLPASAVSAGLAKGRVVFPWGKIRGWLEPPPSSPAAAPEDTELVLPLKIVAPAFLACTKKPAAERKFVPLDESIPALFSSGHVETMVQISALPPAAPMVLAETPVAIARDPHKAPETVGEALGMPEKREWTPAEIIAHLVRLPGVAGAIVSLQEGLPVATSLPDGIKSEVVAAFLPQIFARLNQYAGEMKLGNVDDLLFTTHGAHCQIYRLGYVYFAVLGKPGESLPWLELRLIAEELARHTKK